MNEAFRLNLQKIRSVAKAFLYFQDFLYDEVFLFFSKKIALAFIYNDNEGFMGVYFLFISKCLECKNIKYEEDGRVVWVEASLQTFTKFTYITLYLLFRITREAYVVVTRSALPARVA